MLFCSIIYMLIYNFNLFCRKWGKDMRFKKLFLLLLLLVFVFSISGCKNNLNEDDQRIASYEKLLKNGDRIDLQIWTYYNNTQMTAFNKIVNEFNNTVGSDKNISIVHRSYNGVVELANALNDSSSENVGALPMPNIFQSYVDDLMNLDIKYSNVASLDKYFTQNELNQYVDTFISEGRYDEANNLKLIPIAKSTEIFMLNKTDYDNYANEYDFDLSKLATAEGLLELSKEYYENTGKAFYGRDAIANMFYLHSKSLNKELFSVDKATNTATLNFDKDMIKKIYDTYYVAYVNGYFKANLRYRSNDLAIGDIQAYVGSTASAGYFPNEIKIDDDSSYPIESYISTVPLFSEGEKYAILQGAGFAVSQSDERKEYAAAVFLKYLSDVDRNIDIAVALDYIPVVKSSLDYNKIKEVVIKNALTKANLPDNDTNRAIIEKQKYNVLRTYEVVIEMFDSHKMYFAQPFKNSANIRKILDVSIQGTKLASMSELINADDMLLLIQEEIKAGLTKEQAIEKCMDGNFEVWYQTLLSLIQIELQK